MRLVIGLGNPGPHYRNTRHNAGFMVVDRLANRHQGAWEPCVQARCALCHIELAGGVVWLAKPQTYMNRSGDCARELLERLECGPEQVLLVVDDFLLDFGRLRFRRGGSDGGHNGIASVLECLHTRAVPRLRVGIGPLPTDVDIIDYVLGDIDDPDDIETLATIGCAAIEYYSEAGMEAAMNHFNGL